MIVRPPGNGLQLGEEETSQIQAAISAFDPSQKWSVHRSAPSYALGQHH